MSQPALQSEDSLIGVNLDNKYRVTRVIGRGGMGVVYEAEHATLGNKVAIKLVLEKYTNDHEAMARFTREAHAATRIGNPHIIQVLDISTAPDGRAFVVMELLQGKPLARLLEEQGALPPQRALSIMRQVLRAVGAAHAKGIVHRDLKPDNIFLLDQESDDGPDFVKLLDFGISKIIDPDLQAAATKLTTTGVVMGTPLYMAPEQAMGADIDHHADIYACGVILYEMLAGRPPFEGHTYAVLVAKLLTTDPTLLSELRPTLAPKLVAAVHRALEKEPENRYPSAEAFLAALPGPQSASAAELAHTLASGKARAVRPPGQPRKRRWPFVAAALIAGLGVGALVMLTNTPSSPAPAADTTGSAGPTVAPLTGKLAIDTVPQGASVRIDDVDSGTTPRTVTLGAGTHRVHVELAGYKPIDREAEVVPDVVKELVLTLGDAPLPETAETPAARAETPAKTPPIRRPTARAGGGATTVKPAATDETPPVTAPTAAPPPHQVTPTPPTPIEHKKPSTGPRPNPYGGERMPNPYP